MQLWVADVVGTITVSIQTFYAISPAGTWQLDFLLDRTLASRACSMPLSDFLRAERLPQREPAIASWTKKPEGLLKLSIGSKALSLFLLSQSHSNDCIVPFCWGVYDDMIRAEALRKGSSPSLQYNSRPSSSRHTKQLVSWAVSFPPWTYPDSGI